MSYTALETKAHLLHSAGCMQARPRETFKHLVVINLKTRSSPMCLEKKTPWPHVSIIDMYP
jgi:hypothetical protein